MRDLEASILWEGRHFYVFRVNARRIEVRKHANTHSVVVGWGSDETQVIRTAQRLERYPHHV
jgi:hypothetical protein